jgi:hypothetical protein
MTDDVLLVRLARANPVPFDAPTRPAPVRHGRRRPLIVLAAVAAIAVPAAGFGSRLGGLVGLGSDGTTVSTRDVPESSQPVLGQGMASLDWPSTSQLLGTRGDTSFYASTRRDGALCLAIDVDHGGPGSLITCLPPDLAATDPVMGEPFATDGTALHRLAGVAADRIARVALLAADGSELASAPVVDHLYLATGTPDVPAAAVVAYDASGTEVYRHALGAPPSQTQPSQP